MNTATAFVLSLAFTASVALAIATSAPLAWIYAFAFGAAAWRLFAR